MLQATDGIGQNTEIVEPGENPITVMQGIDHLSDDELGIVIRDGLSDELTYLRHTGDGVWLRHIPATNTIAALWADDLDTFFELYNGGRTDIGIIPVAATPLWGDGTFSPDPFFS